MGFLGRLHRNLCVNDLPALFNVVALGKIMAFAQYLNVLWVFRETTLADGQGACKPCHAHKTATEDSYFTRPKARGAI